jgi:hypothetical protein
VRGLSIVVLGLIAGTAHAEPEAPSTYLVDGGAGPLLWAPLAGSLVLDPDLLRDWDTPSVIATSAGLALGAGIAATRDGSAPYHLKGLAESAMMSTALTGAFDAVSGQRTNGTSGVFAVGTYGALYLHGHVLGGVRPAWQIAAYSAIGLGTMAIAAERVVHDGREWTDVAVGGALGIATSTLFYLYQDGRFVKHRERSLKIAPTFTSGVPALSFVGTF